jgi:Rieske Fe-S protein
VLTRRELAALTLAAAAAPLAACGDGDDRWQDVGTLDGVPADGWVRRQFTIEGLPPYGVLLRRAGDGVIALDERCSHQGCPVRYVDDSRRFICICHGAVFSARGKPIAGPANRPLRRREARVVDARVQVAWPS